MMRCRSQKKINIHPTRDSVTDAAANGPLRVALFRPGSKAQCACAAGECRAEVCDTLYVFDESGANVATFRGAHFRATDEQTSQGVSGLCIYKVPVGTRDERHLPLSDALARMNQRNAEFWKRDDEPEHKEEPWQRL